MNRMDAARKRKREKTAGNNGKVHVGHHQSGTDATPISLDGDSRPTITISTEEMEVNNKAVEALRNDQSIFQRGGMLVRVVRDSSPAANGIRRPFAPRIELLPPALVRERLAAVARWVTLKRTEDGIQEMPGRPPAWSVNAVCARGEWHGIRHLEAVVDYPVLCPDGTILDKVGYDPATGLLLEPGVAMVGMVGMFSLNPTRDDAVRAVAQLLDVVRDFPFESDVYKSAWLAGLLTTLARFTFHGPAPLFLVDSNIRGSGKGLLLDCIARIITGERFTVATYTSDENELRKRITSLALGGDRLVLFDNLTDKFGCGVLDAMLTATSWEDRLLGVNRIVRAPLFATWFATGNNVGIAADTSRWICHCRLESSEERPELRQGFAHPHLLAWVGENRSRLLGQALTIPRAYFVAGRPDQRLPAWGSFEAWSGLIRNAIVWSGLPDPGETRQSLQDRADVTAEAMGVLLGAWQKMEQERGQQGWTAAEVVQHVFKDSHNPTHAYIPELRDAIEALAGRGDAKALGYKLRAHKRRIFGGLFLDHVSHGKNTIRWGVFPAESFFHRAKISPQSPPSPPAQGGDGGNGGHVPAQAEIGIEDGIVLDAAGQAWIEDAIAADLGGDQ